jgi:hypothetical protein
VGAFGCSALEMSNKRSGEAFVPDVPIPALREGAVTQLRARSLPTIRNSGVIPIWRAGPSLREEVADGSVRYLACPRGTTTSPGEWLAQPGVLPGRGETGDACEM